MKKLLFTLLTIVAIVGCSKDLDEDKSIVLTGGPEPPKISLPTEKLKREGLNFLVTECWLQK